jgi:hypothetical protein
VNEFDPALEPIVLSAGGGAPAPCPTRRIGASGTARKSPDDVQQGDEHQEADDGVLNHGYIVIRMIRFDESRGAG